MTLRDPNDSNGGKLVLGGSDASLYTGEMNYIPLTRLGYWQVAMDSISVAGDKVWQLKSDMTWEELQHLRLSEAKGFATATLASST